MAQHGEMIMPVRLTVGEVTSEVIGEIGWPVRSEQGEPVANGISFRIVPGSFDEVRPSLAALLRAAADEIESPSTDVALSPSCS